MKSFQLLGLCAALLACAAANAAGPAPVVDIPVDHGAPLQTEPTMPRSKQEAKDIKEIDALWDHITEAYVKRDPIAAMAGLLNSDDFVEFDMVMPFSDPGYDRNMEKTKAWMNQSKGPTQVTYFDRKIVMLGPDSAYGIAYVHFVGTTLAGDVVDRTARHTRIIRKIKGQWIATLEHTSVPEGWSVKL